MMACIALPSCFASNRHLDDVNPSRSGIYKTEKSTRKHLRRSLNTFLDQPEKGVKGLVEFAEGGGDVNVVHKSTTLLCEASRHGNMEGVQYLLQHGADINLCDKVQCSPVNLAASHGQFAVLEKLVTAGADLDRRNQNGYTALVSAILNVQDKCAVHLIDAGADVNNCRPTTFGGTVDISLLCYVLIAKRDTNIAEKLLRAGTMPHQFTQPLDYILLEDSKFPLDYLKRLLAAGFPVYCDGWVNMMKHLGDEELSRTQRNLLELLQFEHQNARSLQRLSRIAIRNTLILNPTKTHMLKKIESLPLPVEIRKYVALEYL